MNEGVTTAPKHLTESDLITLMNNTGIGTDATIHEHIKNVQDREYARKQSDKIVPTRLGLSLVEVYAKMGIDLYKPFLRAQMEADMKQIAEGEKSKEETHRTCLNEMRKIFSRTIGLRQEFISFFAERFRSDQNANADRMNYGGNDGGGGPGGPGGPGGFGGGGNGGKPSPFSSSNSVHSNATASTFQRQQPGGGGPGNDATRNALDATSFATCP